MAKIFENVYQFKITLRDTHPPIWRRIQVPETFTFWDLHFAIQDSMGWEKYHLHDFEITDKITKEKTLIGKPS
ncbi:plasmid pRiA4b ORF-3 family protein, partial [bacterium]|nr:plasmid pRiA4b ORF-3 family protein [bacterium]